MSSRRLRTSLLIAVCLALGSTAADARTLQQGIDASTRWLERLQNVDGSWGSGATVPLVTSEAVLALAKVGRSGFPPAQRGVAWLRSQRFESIDYRARRVRALAAAGADVSAEATTLATLGIGSAGWGPVSGAGPTSYDSALVLGALAAAAQLPGDLNTRVTWVLARRRFDSGWSGDGVATGASDLITTGEITRAMAPPVTNVALLDPTYGYLGGSVTLTTPTLEVAARLAAFHAKGVESTALRDSLLHDSRFVTGETWSSDPYVNAIGLLALATTPGGGYTPPPGYADFDRDGVADVDDWDDDGDGVIDIADIAPFDAARTEDWDGDANPDETDDDDDGDGILDVVELEQGSNPTGRDTDGDQRCDGALILAGCTSANDPCPTVANGTDADGDGVCTPLDACPNDPTDFADLNADGQCDGDDDDDDGDLVKDVDEIAAGTDPRSPLSKPASVATTEPNGDFDRDGLTNGFEGSHGLSPYRADTDADGALDWLEYAVEPSMPAIVNPYNPAKQPPAVLAVFSNGSPGQSGNLMTGGGYASTASFGQVTPVGNEDALGAPSSGFVGSDPLVCLDGFQPMTILGRDLDGDGIEALVEGRARLGSFDPDTDDDGFADGADGFVVASRIPNAWDLDDDGWADGEADYDTDPLDPDSHPGMAGDVAPLGAPNGTIDLADLLVVRRIFEDADIIDALPTPQQRALATEAADVDGNTHIRIDDLMLIKQQVIP